MKDPTPTPPRTLYLMLGIIAAMVGVGYGCRFWHWPGWLEGAAVFVGCVGLVGLDLLGRAKRK